MRIFLTKRFQADHSLSMREARHLHAFEITVAFDGKVGPIGGDAGSGFNLLDLDEWMDSRISAIAGTYLNENVILHEWLPAARQAPMCETLAEAWLRQVRQTWEHDARIDRIGVTVKMLDFPSGAVGGAEAEWRRPSQWIFVQKEALQFSAAHFTLFADGTREGLHGHNYRTALAVRVAQASSGGALVPFAELKSALALVIGELDHRVLVPGASERVRVRGGGAVASGAPTTAESEVMIDGDRYVFPERDLRVIPVANVSTEELARWIGERITARLSERGVMVNGLRLRVDETTGQGAEWEPERLG